MRLQKSVTRWKAEVLLELFAALIGGSFLLGCVPRFNEPVKGAIVLAIQGIVANGAVIFSVVRVMKVIPVGR